MILVCDVCEEHFVGPDWMENMQIRCPVEKCESVLRKENNATY